MLGSLISLQHVHQLHHVFNIHPTRSRRSIAPTLPSTQLRKAFATIPRYIYLGAGEEILTQVKKLTSLENLPLQMHPTTSPQKEHQIP